MIWGDELKRVRRYLRDPSGTIWTDDFLRHLWNDCVQDFLRQTIILEDIHAQRVPGLFQCAYLYDFEYRFLNQDQTQFYQALNQHDDYVICHRWETQEITGIDSDVSDYGAHFTQPWEACMGMLPGETLKFKFPANFHELKFIAYDEEPITPTSKKAVQSSDPSYITREGEPFAYYVEDEGDNTYVLYPRPSTVFVNDLEGEGMAFFAEGDTEDTTTGQIAVREGSTDSSDIGGAVDIVDTADNLFMVYTIAPIDVESVSDELSIPNFLCKYVRCGVIARAYGGNNDGRIRSLSDYWENRYRMGIVVTKRYMTNKRQDRDYRLSGGSVRRRRPRHARLPDGFPASPL